MALVSSRGMQCLHALIGLQAAELRLLSMCLTMYLGKSVRPDCRWRAASRQLGTHTALGSSRASTW